MQKRALVSLVKEITTIISKPIELYFPHIFVLSFLLYIPLYIDYSLLGLCYVVTTLIINGNYLISFGIVYTLFLIPVVFRSFNIYIIYIYQALINTLFFGDLFLYSFFNGHINAGILQLLAETNQTETSGFVACYIYSSKFVLFIVIVIVICLLEYIIVSLLTKLSRIVFEKSRWIGILVAVYAVLSLFFSLSKHRIFSNNVLSNIEYVRGTEQEMSFIFVVYNSFLQFFDEFSSFENSARANDKLKAGILGNNTPDVILIIGESFDRHHSNLYGYNKRTNPSLSCLDSLYIYDNVISPINSTSECFKHFMSLSSVDDSSLWYDTPLFPAIFKAAGFNVIFYSNQFVKEARMSSYDASCGFFNHPLLSPKLFNHKNTVKYKYDEDLLNDFKSNRKAIERDSLNLIMFHLYGQHFPAASRFPQKRVKFTPLDYDDRSELTDIQKKEVADYDNATVYNDSIVSKIIELYKNKNAVVIYFADHGEEANDYRPHIGRTRKLNGMGSACIHCQLDIPFLIYTTPAFKKYHHQMDQMFRQSIHKPFMIDDLPHLLISIAGIQTEWYSPPRSFIESKYNSGRRRIISGYSTTTPIDYDSVCQHINNYYPGYFK